jgi:hypothetical protein
MWIIIIIISHIGGCACTVSAVFLQRNCNWQCGLPEVADASDDALHPILAVTGGNPWAIKLVVGQLVSLPLD